MKLINKILILLSVTLLAVSCNKDNYAEPAGSIKGAVVDAETGDSVQTETPNGSRIQLFEQGRSAVAPVNFWAMPNGAFENTRVFDATYKIIATGPFFPADTATVSVSGVSSEPLIFKVIPYLRIAQSISKITSSSITVKYKISRSKEGGKIARKTCLIGANKYVNVNAYLDRKLDNTEAASDTELLAGEYTETFEGLKPGVTYYIRSGARTINDGSLYNYTPAVPVTTLTN